MLAAERALLAAASAAVLFASVAGVAGFRLNLSPSVVGMVFRIDDAAEILVGDYVSFCLPTPLASLPVMATATVPVCMQDQRGVPLLKRVAVIDDDGSLFVLGEHPKSLDSRVFGWIDRQAIRHRLVRVW